MKAYINENLASSVLDCILNFYVANPYVLIGCGNGGVWQDREFLSTQSAINRALEMISSCKRLQNLVLRWLVHGHLSHLWPYLYLGPP